MEARVEVNMLINVFGCLVPVGRSKQALHLDIDDVLGVRQTLLDRRLSGH